MFLRNITVKTLIYYNHRGKTKTALIKLQLIFAATTDRRSGYVHNRSLPDGGRTAGIPAAKSAADFYTP